MATYIMAFKKHKKQFNRIISLEISQQAEHCIDGRDHKSPSNSEESEEFSNPSSLIVLILSCSSLFFSTYWLSIRWSQFISRSYSRSISWSYSSYYFYLLTMSSMQFCNYRSLDLSSLVRAYTVSRWLLSYYFNGVLCRMWQFDIDLMRERSWHTENQEVEMSSRFRNLRSFSVIGLCDICFPLFQYTIYKLKNQFVI